MVDILRNVWRCQRVVVDATGIGATLAAFLSSALGQSIVEQFVFTAPGKSQLGYDLLSAINAGRLKVYTQNADSLTIADFWRQCQRSRYDLRANQIMSWYVPIEDGHDDLLTSLALVNRAAAGFHLTPASAHIPTPPSYQDGRF
jgi:phage FluMu gp28-like protein